MQLMPATARAMGIPAGKKVIGGKYKSWSEIYRPSTEYFL